MRAHRTEIHHHNRAIDAIGGRDHDAPLLLSSLAGDLET